MDMTDELEQFGTDGDVDDLDEPEDLDVAGPVYDTLNQWVTDWLAPIALRHAGGSGAWCARWWAHPEATARLGALWAAWEAAWADGGTGPSAWWILHWGPQWEALSAPSGTFGGCSGGNHRDVPPHRPLEPLPEEYQP